MKKFKFIFFAALVLAALSCQKESFPKINEDTNPESELVPLTLSTGEATKTHIANGTEIHWDLGDKITVFTNEYFGLGTGSLATNAFDDFKMDGEPNGSFVRFTGEIAKGSSIIWAVYPSAQAESCSTSGDNFIVKLPSLQTPTPGSFDPMANVSVAKTTIEKNGSVGTYEPSANVNFKNVGSLLKFTIPQGVKNISSVTLTADAPIAGKLKLDFAGDAPTLEMNESGDYIINEAVNSIQMKKLDANGNKVYFADNQTYWFVLAPIKVKKLSLFIDTDNKQYGANFSFPSSTQLNPGEYKNLGILNISSWPSFEVNYSVRDEGGVLNGTDVVFNFSRNDVSHINLTVTKEGASSPCRTINVTNPELNSNNQYVSTYDNQSWPYLPKGRYFVSGAYTTSDGVVDVTDYSFVIDTDPNFTVGSFEAYTSYTKYTSKTSTAVADANACDGASIYVNASNVSISDKILKNSNYKNMIQVQFVAPASGYGVSNLTNGITATLTNQQYGEYKSPSYIFDETAVTFSTLSCHVTGLPYVLDPAKNDSVNPWGVASTNDILYVSWTGSALKVGGNSVGENVGAIKSFYVPEKTSINVTASASGSVTGGRLKANTGSVKLGGTELVSSTAEKGSLFGGTKTVTFSKTDSKSMSISTSNSQLSCSVTYGLLDAHMLVESLMILYR